MIYYECSACGNMLQAEQVYAHEREHTIKDEE